MMYDPSRLLAKHTPALCRLQTTEFCSFDAGFLRSKRPPSSPDGSASLRFLALAQEYE
jgi:hypothetical protein